MRKSHHVQEIFRYTAFLVENVTFYLEHLRLHHRLRKGTKASLMVRAYVHLSTHLYT